ncbi:DNA-methyltransferase [Streptomyces sp. NPDC001404]|uniref:DNA-methyltransferase n=1 Tax=Streptomyces sp. NPDC001404 TaxID=3364571 RepID=UPI003687EF61
MSTYYHDDQVTLLLGDALDVLCTLPNGAVDCIVTSPPYYGLRDYGTDGQYGLEATPAEYVETMREVFAEARRVLADSGTLWLNLGDSYVAGPPGKRRSSGLQGRSQAITTPEGLGDKMRCGIPEKNLMMIPARVALALQDDGWLLRNDIIWSRPNAMPESVGDRMSTRYEHVFLFAKRSRYWFDLDAVREPHKAPGRRAGAGAFTGRNANHPRTGTGEYTGLHPKGRNPGDIWEIATQPNRSGQTNHFAVFPMDLPLRCIKAGCKPGGTVLDPFSGSGTTGAAARQLGCHYVGIDLNPRYHDLAVARFAQGVLDFDETA